MKIRELIMLLTELVTKIDANGCNEPNIIIQKKDDRGNDLYSNVISLHIDDDGDIVIVAD